MGPSDGRKQLRAAKKEIDCLKQRLEKKHMECMERAKQNAELVNQCKDRSGKVTELMDILRAQKSGVIGEKVVEKGLQNAELVVQLAGLQQRLQESETALARTKEEKRQADQMLKRVKKNEDLELVEVEEEKVAKLLKERDSYKTMALGLGDIVRSLNAITIPYDKHDRNSNPPTSAVQSQNHSLNNVRRKVDAIERDRQCRIEENEILRREGRC